MIDKVKKNSNDFSVVDTLAQAVTNSEFIKGKLQLDSNEKTSYTYIWEALSAIGQDIGETLYSNVLNYIDNVCNIDVCKISALKSMLKAYGIKYTLFDNLGIFPAKIADMLDILSVNKKYLRNTNVLNKDFVSFMLDESNGIASSIYDESALSKMLYKYFRTNITVSDDAHSMPYEGKYTLANDYSYEDVACHIVSADTNPTS